MRARNRQLTLRCRAVSATDGRFQGCIVFGLAYAVIAAGNPLIALSVGFLALLSTVLDRYTAVRYDCLMRGGMPAGRCMPGEAGGM